MNEALDLARAIAAKEQEGWAPQPAQWAALSCPADELLYGGAAGGGKTDVLLLDALREAWHKSYKGVIFRRTYPELEEVVERAKILIPAAFPGAKESTARHEWRFPAGGKLLFRHLQDLNAAHAHRSAEYCYIGFDELTTFDEQQYRYLFTRARNSKGLTPRIRAATNPGGLGHEWVKKRFAPWLDKNYPDPALPGELRGVYPDPDTSDDIWVYPGTPGSLTRTFIPAKLSDNRVLTDADPTYRAKLRAQDPLTRKQLEDGDWDAKPAPKTFFNRDWMPLVDASPTKARRVRYWDRAATAPNPMNPDPDWTVGILLAYVEVENLYYVEDMKRARLNPGGVKYLIKETTETDGDAIEQVLSLDPSQAGVFEGEEYLSFLDGWTVSLDREHGDKLTRAKPTSAQASPIPGRPYGKFRVVKGPWNGVFFSEIEGFDGGGKKKKKKDIVDSFCGAHRVLARGGGCEGEGGGSYTLADVQGLPGMR